ncbi:phosphoribosylformylglycinamidine synthase subunit PurL [Bacteroidia bacterium]|nr:phosphoribosylformylglycinamidine synthase subunit PurL [Bacteroidia bacterium]
MNHPNQPLAGSREERLQQAQNLVGRAFNPQEKKLIESLWATAVTEKTTVNESGKLTQSETGHHAGIVELTDEYDCVFRSTPVNASSVSSPARTYGAICQDLFVHGAQPLATLLTLTLNENASVEQSEVWKAIHSLSSSINVYGIPMVGGDVCFCKTEHISAGMLSIGVIDKATQLFPASNGEGNRIYLLSDDTEQGVYGSRTMYELICDLHDEGLIKALHSVNQSGVLGACAEMVANGQNGVLLHADLLIGQLADFKRLLQYQPNQIIVIVSEEQHSDMERICRKWNKQWLHTGTVTDERLLSVHYQEKSLAEIPADVLALFTCQPKTHAGDATPDAATLPRETCPDAQGDNSREIAGLLMHSPNLKSRQWFFNRFDSTVGGNTLSTNFISDTPVMQIKGTHHALAVAFGSSLHDLAKYPNAAALLVAEVMRKAVCSGGEPLAVTGCLTVYGKTESGKTVAAIRKHIAASCVQLGIASSDVNVAFVSSDKQPAMHLSLGVIAFLEDKHRQMTLSFKGKGDMIYLIGKTPDQPHASEYSRFCLCEKDTPPPAIDLAAEAKLLQVVKQAIARKLVKSAHSVSRGGLFTSLLESAIVRQFGFDVTVDGEVSKELFLFGETPSRIAVSVSTTRETDFIDFMMRNNMPFITLGHITREEIRIDDSSFGFISDYKRKLAFD